MDEITPKSFIDCWNIDNYFDPNIGLCSQVQPECPQITRRTYCELSDCSWDESKKRCSFEEKQKAWSFLNRFLWIRQQKRKLKKFLKNNVKRRRLIKELERENTDGDYLGQKFVPAPNKTHTHRYRRKHHPFEKNYYEILGQGYKKKRAASSH